MSQAMGRILKKFAAFQEKKNTKNNNNKNIKKT